MIEEPRKGDLRGEGYHARNGARGVSRTRDLQQSTRMLYSLDLPPSTRRVPVLPAAGPPGSRTPFTARILPARALRRGACRRAGWPGRRAAAVAGVAVMAGSPGWLVPEPRRYAALVTAYVGTSGFSYAQWKGNFYPAKLANARMLAYYAERLPSVELNNTFYRLPRASALENWRDSVPASFRFAVKAPKAITHFAKLSPNAGQLAPFLEVLGALGGRLGPVLFQLPPTHRQDVSLLSDFIEVLPTELRAAFEFRHPSWFSDAVLDVLGRRGCALVGGDLDEAERNPPLERTAPFAYLRLRKSGYEPGELEIWAERIRRLGCDDRYVYFKHEDTAPALARTLIDLLDGS